MITPREFADQMKEFAKGGDLEVTHGMADDLMCKVLYRLGYGEGVEIFEEMDKWYA